MLGTVFREVLEDLQREGLHEPAKEIQGNLTRAHISSASNKCQVDGIMLSTSLC